MEFNTTEQLGHLPPKPPAGEGWTMCGSTPSAKVGGLSVFMYWQRPKAHQANVCGKCGAMAFLEGKCIGCGTILEN